MNGPQYVITLWHILILPKMVDTSETGAELHSVEYNKNMTLATKRKTDSQFPVKDKSFVTENVSKMHSELKKNISSMQYG